jgi:hypothetical protein
MTDHTTEHLLKDILGFVDGHVKYAETKNAALLAFAAGTLFAFAQVGSEHFRLIQSLPDWLIWYICILVTCFCIAVICALVSFLPKTSIVRRRNNYLGRPSDNLLFFGEILPYESDEYVKMFYAATGINQYRQATGLELMYAEEIIVNAKIASSKFFWFKVAVTFILIGILPPYLGILLVVRLRRCNS